MIANIHRKNTNNAGDIMSAPSLYFPELFDKTLDIIGYKEAGCGLSTQEWESEFAQCDHFVFGGGGLLELDFFSGGFRYAFKAKKPEGKAIIWGAGHNSWQITDWNRIKHPIKLDYPFDLVGVRDHNHAGLDWVPCPSCMSPLLDGPQEPKHEFVLFAHVDKIENNRQKNRFPTDLPTMLNSEPAEVSIPFLASGETILTDSYHGMYWGTLLGRKVIAFPNSSKFYDMKHPAQLCDPRDWRRYVRAAASYPEALPECREANIRFAEKVGNVLER